MSHGSQNPTPTSPAESIGQRVRETRHRRMLTQQQLAKASGVSISALKNIELDKVEVPHNPTLGKLADVLKVAPQFLRFGDDPTALAP